METLNKVVKVGHVEVSHFVFCKEVVRSSEVQNFYSVCHLGSSFIGAFGGSTVNDCIRS